MGKWGEPGQQQGPIWEVPWASEALGPRFVVAEGEEEGVRTRVEEQEARAASWVVEEPAPREVVGAPEPWEVVGEAEVSGRTQLVAGVAQGALA